MNSIKRRAPVSTNAWTTIVIGLAASGCSLAPSGGQIKAAAASFVETAMTDRQDYNDSKADALLRLPCDMSLGAYFRLKSTVQQEALILLCSGRRIGEEAISPK